ncbi:MAG: DUF167 domain-containing protein [Planctomycetota bacterium]
MNPLEDLPLKETTDGIEVNIRAIPGASINAISGIRQGALVVKVTTAPEKGQANVTLSKVLSGTLGIPKGHVRLLRGEHQRNKTFLLAGLDRQKLTTTLEELGIRKV